MDNQDHSLPQQPGDGHGETEFGHARRSPGHRPRPVMLHHRAEAHADGLDAEAAELRAGLIMADQPRRYALCLPDGVADVPVELAAKLADFVETAAVRPGEAIGWGLEYRDRALIYVRDPFSGQYDIAVFDSAEEARTYYSRHGELRVVHA